MNLYIHLPFCRKKCHYCDFHSYPGVSASGVRRYLQALTREMELVAAALRPGKADTLYLGGGTPTYLSGGDLLGLISRVRNILGIEETAEITLEANPGTVTLPKLKALRAVGVNRLSLGAQSFNDNMLRAMGRIHRTEEIYQAFDWARKAGFENINLDLIYGLPGQSLSDWEDTLNRALALEPEHLSTYALELTPETVWGRRQAAGKLRPAAEEEVVAMYDRARAKLRAAGYEQYEISNFARPGWECRHNLVYWENRPYLGLGAGAASHWEGERWQNYASLEAYCEAVEKGKWPIAEREILTRRQQMAETVFLGLRLLRGLSLKEFRNRFGEELVDVYQKELERLTAWGLVEVQGDHLRLTEKGIPLANEVFVAFM
ncbi:MAG: radical SAM family heme chaperone HemW [Moorellaceae bacterium]